MSKLQDAVDDVRDFHVAMGVPVAETLVVPDRHARRLRMRLIHEEADELLKAIDAGDVVETADGIADLVYVALGAALEFGIPIEEVWHEVQRSNMAKVGGGRRADGKILKPEGWRPPDIPGVLMSSIKRHRGWYGPEDADEAEDES